MVDIRVESSTTLLARVRTLFVKKLKVPISLLLLNFSNILFTDSIQFYFSTVGIVTIQNGEGEGEKGEE